MARPLRFPRRPVQPSHNLRCLWGVLAAFAATLLVFAVHGQTSPFRLPGGVGALSAQAPAGYAGSNACAGCHAPEATAWAQSHHAEAMKQATAATVLGDFSDVTIQHKGSRARFFRDGERFLVEIQESDGKSAVFEIGHTFGVAPLQQYLVGSPDGRLQALPYAWDSRPKDQGGQRWFNLYPDEVIVAGSLLHWKGPQQNWNYMCADCHSTAVRKGYDAAANTFRTTFSEISVGCEACHGPGAGHVGWATGGRDNKVTGKGFAHATARRPQPDWTPDPVTGSPAQGVPRPAADEMETCGTCHSRRGQFAEGWTPGQPLMDFYRPVFLTPDLFEDDGVMKDEVFNLASFQQSKMFAKGVICSDCHDPHSGRLKAGGSSVCAQCHAPARFATAAHSGHTDAGQPDCIACHMPARTYMVVDRRHDHGFRVPRPDLTASLGVPSACAGCHADKPALWAAAAVERWHGSERKGFQTYAAAFHAARTGSEQSRSLLLDAAEKPGSPAVARATALALLQAWPAATVEAAWGRAARDPDPLVRLATAEAAASLPQQRRWGVLGRLLADPIRAVRIEAASALAGAPAADQVGRQAFANAAAEYDSAERFNADRVESRANLGRFLAQIGEPDRAESEFRAAMRLGPAVAARVGLADLFRVLGRENDAELLLRQTVSLAPDAPEPRHALGLALIRQHRLPEALEPLRRAYELAPAQPRFGFVYALGLQSAGRPDDALAVLRAAAAISPWAVDLQSALLQVALQNRDVRSAIQHAQRLRTLEPDDAALERLAEQLRRAQSSAGAPP
ncbi:hypothetical protein SLNSH_06310 [Alsobacter soli]|uniref:Tetratricopeptide repeat protein n=1 Tax=Alsobacter soli TaxID=2109933 RepID=A0A2T1HWI7_9HYPH|nr:cytochrome c3 family protein [Alsobacter soli]PSC05984.1 hypothetical protein SLNSH_06310 [Alsobacter soli]